MDKEEGIPAGNPQMVPGAGIAPVYISRFYLTANDQVLRLVVGDSIGGTDQTFFYSLAMSRADAIWLASTMQQLLTDTDPNKSDQDGE